MSLGGSGPGVRWRFPETPLTPCGPVRPSWRPCGAAAWSRHGRCLPRVADCQHGTSLCRPMPTATAFNRRPFGTNAATMRRDSETGCADARKSPPKVGDQGFDASLLHGRESRPRGSRDAHRPASRCAASIDRAIHGHELGLNGLLNTSLLRLPRCVITEPQRAGPRCDE